ncbi:DUF533 domain-containing protein [Coralloluteibacterium stylophorae]|uniref:DUF533 domain-containing protein n=1 Tax=Coralloluteibacterium stylophorae TaxID=1776034 RepID=A0A8J7VVT3_9GAMM|nr:DUF533 domain-containing protein [Coralloluteibacterium stylophorae]MBS7456110.1 DUF533 domain-containing protein [Coralloluteibacterium stylophorae]
MFDARHLLGQMLGESLGGGYGKKKRKKHQRYGLAPGNASGLGGFVGRSGLALGALGVAYAAWEHYREQDQARAGTPAAAPAGTPPPPPARSAATAPMTPEQQDALALVRAMIAAAHADGLIDSQEHRGIVSRAREAGLDTEALAALDHELAHPLPLERLIATLRDGLAADAYAASLLAIRVDTPAERDYLARLADALGLDAAARAGIEARLLPPAPPLP